MSQTLEQKRAKYALEVINRQRNGSSEEDYGRHVRKFPAMVLNNGLGQALAFLLADDKEASKTLYEDIQKWLCGAGTVDYPRRIYPGNGLIKSLMEGGRSHYLHAQQEVLSLLVWVKKFADAYLPKSGGS